MKRTYIQMGGCCVGLDTSSCSVSPASTCFYVAASSQGHPRPWPGGPDCARLLQAWRGRSWNSGNKADRRSAGQGRGTYLYQTRAGSRCSGAKMEADASKAVKVARRRRVHESEASTSLGRVMGLGRRIVGHRVNGLPAALALVGSVASGARRETRMQQSNTCTSRLWGGFVVV